MEIQLLSNVRDIKDFVSEQNKNYDIYAYVISGWHLGTVYSYLLSLGKHVKRKVLILMSTDRINNEMIKSFPQFEIDYIRTIDMSDVTNNLKLNKILKLKEDGNKQKVTVLTPFGYSLGFFNLILQFLEGHSIDFVKYDEGLVVIFLNTHLI